MIVDDNTRIGLAKEISLFGIKNIDSSYFNSKDYDNLKNTMKESFNGKEKHMINNLRLCTSTEVLSYGKNFILKYIGKGGIMVPENTNGKLNTELMSKFPNPSRENLNEMVDYINNNYKKSYVYNVPVHFAVFEPMEITSNRVDTFSDNFPPEFYNNLQATCAEIVLGGTCSILTKDRYVHEMTHTLLNKEKGSVENKLDRELLPIFMEKLSSKEQSSDILDVENYNRVVSTNDNINNLETSIKNNTADYRTFNNMGYILSTVLSSDLFEKYEKRDDKVKKEMINSIKNIFKGKTSLEETLKKYDINTHDGTKTLENDIKKYIK